MLSDQGFWFVVCRNLHYCSTACNCFVITTYCSSHYSKKKSVACSNFHLDCYWKVFLQVLAASDLATIRCPGVPCWFALQSQRRVLMQEGHKPSVSKQGDRICCHVLLPHVVCLQEGAIWLCVCVCVLLRAMGLDEEIGPTSSLMTIECVSQDDSLLRAPGWHFAQPHAHSSHCRKPKRTVLYVHVCAAHTE